MTEPTTDPTLEGRYEVLGTLGAGASGVVQEVRDLERGGRVALKRLHRESPLDVARLRQEFRALADVFHPNLVRLHELISDGDHTIFTMDVVDGLPFLHHVWGVPRRADATIITGHSWPTLSAGLAAEDAPEDRDPQLPERPPLTDAMLQRLRRSLKGLASGLQALHAVGLLHRDVKPSNVLVDTTGEVILLDFGLIVRRGVGSTAIAGTVPYMSPEQAMGATLGPEADWYALGVILFEALTGRTPFVGSSAQMLFDKQLHDPPPVRDLAPDAPDDLATLCDSLIQRDPDLRPDGEVIGRLLGVTPLSVLSVSPFVGRSAELELLLGQHALGGRRMLRVRGPSGLGKTRLVEQMIAQLPPRTMVLAARCYEREQSRFKALDPLIHSLTASLDEQPLGRELPRDLALATVLFPSLARLTGPASPPAIDPLTLRRRATRALRQLLVDVANERVTLLWIDDLQWADIDSLRILAELFTGEDPPACTLVLGHRTDDPQSADLLEVVDSIPYTAVDLQPLSPNESASLARAHLGDRTALVDRVVAESQGNPFFLGEFARWLASGGGEEGRSLWQSVLAARLASLPATTISLLHVVATAGRPLLPELALAAARAQQPDAGPGDVTALTVQRLLTTRRGRSLECTHDRLRESITAQLAAPQQREIHRAIAEAMGSDADPELLSEHWEQASEAALAASHALVAAKRAEQAAAFERAVALYRRALRLGIEDPHAVKAALGQAMSWAGLGDAADVILEAARDAEGPEQARLEREATHQLLRAGHYERAYTHLPRVVGALGMRWPASRRAALAEVVWNSLQAKLPIPRLRRTDPETLHVVMELAMSLAYADMLRSAVFSTRAILLAASVADAPLRAVASAMRASNAALLGDPDTAVQQIEAAWALAPTPTDDLLAASIAVHEGIVDIVAGRFQKAAEGLDRAVRTFDDRGGRPYELNMARSFLVYAILQTGRIAEYRSLRNRAIEECRIRGMKAFEVLYRTTYPLQPGLLDDDPEAVAANLSEAESRWGEGTSSMWLSVQTSWAQLHLYRGEHAEAHRVIEATAAVAEKNGLLAITPNALLTHIVRAAAAGPLAREDAGARKVLDDAIRRIRAVKSNQAISSLHTWRAAQLGIEGRWSEALVENQRALDAIDRIPVPYQRAMVEIQRAWLSGAPDQEPLQRLAVMGVTAPAKLTCLYAWAPRRAASDVG